MCPGLCWPFLGNLILFRLALFMKNVGLFVADANGALVEGTVRQRV